MTDFTEGKIPPQLIKFTLPTLFANLLQAFYSIANAIWVGRLIGHVAFAAVSATGPLIFMLVSAIVGLTLTANVLVGQACGTKMPEYLRKVLNNNQINKNRLPRPLHQVGVLAMIAFFELLQTANRGLLSLVS